MIKNIFICIVLILSFSGCALNNGSASQNKIYECDEAADKSLMSGDLERGVKLHEEYVKIHPENSIAFYHLGYAMGMLGAKDAEIYYYEKSASLGYKKSGDLYFNLGMAYSEIEKYDKAEKAFLKSLSLQPGRSEARLILAKIYIEYFKTPEKAEEQLIIVLGIDPENQEAHELMRLISTPE